MDNYGFLDNLAENYYADSQDEDCCYDELGYETYKGDVIFRDEKTGKFYCENGFEEYVKNLDLYELAALLGFSTETY